MSVDQTGDDYYDCDNYDYDGPCTCIWCSGDGDEKEEEIYVDWELENEVSDSTGAFIIRTMM